MVRLARLLGIDVTRCKRSCEAQADPLRNFAGRFAVAHDAARLSHRRDCRVELRDKCAAKALETPDEPGAIPQRAASTTERSSVDENNQTCWGKEAFVAADIDDIVE